MSFKQGTSERQRIYFNCLKAVFLLVLFLVVLSCKKQPALRDDPETAECIDGIRIAWDHRTLRKIAPSYGRAPGYYGYARMEQLHDGRIACVYETSGGDIEMTTSSNYGVSWSWPKVIFSDANEINMAVPDIIELSDNSILIACNTRPREPFTIDRKFGIKVRRSNNSGQSWGTERLLYEAQPDLENGCWEPSFLQLPDGEVQLYFSNEGIYLQTSEQNISIFRSFDFGETWTGEPEIVGFRASRRDGMPVALVLEDKGEILASIEDNKEGEFKPSIYRESLEKNWSDGFIAADDPRRSYHPLSDRLKRDIYAGGPFLGRLGTGEVLLSYQTTQNRNKVWNFSSMAVEISDDKGALFSRRTIPFEVPVNKWGLWNSLAVIDQNTLVAVTSTNAYSENSTEVWMIMGRIVPEVTIPKGTPVINGSFDDPCWKIPAPYFTGHKGDAYLSASLCSDDQNLYVSVLVNDNEIVSSDGTEGISDGVIIQVDTERKGYIQPHTGIFEFMLGAADTLFVREGCFGLWKRMVSGSLEIFEIQSDSAYQFELAIPLDFLRILPGKTSKMGINFVLRNGSLIKKDYEESMGSNDPGRPNTWCPVVIN
jgi:hypothetical protein